MSRPVGTMLGDSISAPAQSFPTAPMRAKGFLGETWKWRAQRPITTSLSGSIPTGMR